GPRRRRSRSDLGPPVRHRAAGRDGRHGLGWNGRRVRVDGLRPAANRAHPLEIPPAREVDGRSRRDHHRSRDLRRRQHTAEPRGGGPARRDQQAPRTPGMRGRHPAVGKTIHPASGKLRRPRPNAWPANTRMDGMREEAPSTAALTSSEKPEDENLWLEDITGEEQISWVKDQNAKTLNRFRDELFDSLSSELRTALDSDDRIPMVTKRGDWYYNFWRDEANPKGLWRRTTWDSCRTPARDWEILLDLDELAAVEDTGWVWSG